ncbi:MAG: hypothetical protein ACRDQ0_05990 [Pseudonocardia sp.]
MANHHRTTETADCPSGLCDEQQHCLTCDGSGDGCDQCNSTGRVTPEHCCACGGSPYCQCCRGCGEYAGTCGCPQPVEMQNGRVKTL